MFKFVNFTFDLSKRPGKSSNNIKKWSVQFWVNHSPVFFIHIYITLLILLLLLLLILLLCLLSQALSPWYFSS